MVPEIVKRKRHEIGVLGWSDENVAALNDAARKSRLLTRAIERLTKAAGRKPVGARGPSGTISLHTMALLKKAGLLYDSTLQARDEAYEVLLEGQASGIVELPSECLPQRLPVPDVGAHGTGAAAVARADLRNVSRRFRRRVPGRDDVGPDASPARRRHAVAHHLSRSADSVHESGSQASGSRRRSRSRATSNNRRGSATDAANR